jgi:hypothetical protein
MSDVMDDEGYDEVEIEREPPPPSFLTVCPFLVDRAYGGPEEGGWWYGCGTPEHGQNLPIPQIFFVQDREQAREACRLMQEQLDETVNVGRREISSVLSEGRYAAQVCDNWPEPYPKHRPHYE